MRICLYTDTALPKMGGQELVVDALARQYQQLGHAVTVLAPLPRRPLRPRDQTLPYAVVRHPRFYSTRYFVEWYRWWLWQLHQRRPFDVLHCHGIYPTGYLATLLRHRHQAPVVITSHGGDVREGSVRISKPRVQQRAAQAIQAADALVAISRFTEAGYLRFGANPARIQRIPNGVDGTALQTPIVRPPELDPAIEPGEYVLFLGRLKERKGADLLLLALPNVPDTGRVQLVLAGDGEEMPRLRQLCEQRQLQARVRFVGAVSGPLKGYLLQNARCTAMPSRVWEAFPLVVLESFAAGTPVLATRVPGLEDLIETDRTGWLVAPESAEELAGALSYVLAQPELCRTRGRQAAQLAQSFHWSAIAQRHIDLFDRLLRRTQHRQAL